MMLIFAMNRPGSGSEEAPLPVLTSLTNLIVRFGKERGHEHDARIDDGRTALCRWW